MLGADADVVIIGGGPAGLLLAHLLSPEYRVIVFEKGKVGTTSKFWATTTRRLGLHALGSCAVATPSQVTISTFLGGTAVATGDVAVTDDKRLLATLLARCDSAGVTIVDQAEVTSLQWQQDGIRVAASGTTVRTRLIVDCTGGLSPIASTFQLHRLLGFFAIYGGHVADASFASNELVLASVLRLGHRRYSSR